MIPAHLLVVPDSWLPVADAAPTSFRLRPYSRSILPRGLDDITMPRCEVVEDDDDLGNGDEGKLRTQAMASEAASVKPKQILRLSRFA